MLRSGYAQDRPIQSFVACVAPVSAKRLRLVEYDKLLCAVLDHTLGDGDCTRLAYALRRAAYLS